MSNVVIADLRCTLSTALAERVRAVVASWEHARGTARLWAKDASLWTGRDEARWLGWLDIVAAQRSRLTELAAVATLARDAGCRDAVLLGMGGSSLCAEVLAESLGSRPGFPTFHVLDSTVPAQVRAVEARIDPARALFIVASKSGTTLEPDILRAYFWDRAGRDGRHFVAITDPGSHLEQEARRDGYRAVYHGVPEIGGRFSALSNFGLVPAAVMGLDVARLLAEAERMVQASSRSQGVESNPGVALGLVLGTAAAQGLDKLTLLASSGIAGLGAWLEQLVAESTGKQGKAIIPVDGEEVGPPAVYGADRLFVHLRLDGGVDKTQDEAVAALEQAGMEVVRIAVPGTYALSAEFFRWEMATAVAGSLLGVNPYDQPDVEASKVATRALTAEFERTGALPAEDCLSVTDDRCEAGLRALLDSIRPGDYFAALAYVEMHAVTDAALQTIRHRVRDARHVATCVGFGPRFLHSTGQAYKGGPNTGVFLQITADDAEDVPVPGRRFSFGVVKSAQATGDFQVLAARGRRVLRVHLGPDVRVGLGRLDELVESALRGSGSSGRL